MRIPGRTWRARLVALGWTLLAVPGLAQLGLLVYAVLSRLRYPYDLEWMEGGILDHAERLRAGEGLYVPPSVDFTPFPYTPLYPALLAALGRVAGVSYTLGRLVSILAMLAIVALMAVAIRRGAHERDRLPALVGMSAAAGFFAATYPWVEGWYDLVRGDTLFVALALGGLVLLRRVARRGAPGLGGHLGVAAAAALLALSFFCKQNGLFFVAVGGVLLLVWRSFRQIPVYIAVSGALGLGGVWLLNQLSDGWFWFYAYEILGSHEINMDRFYRSFGNILWRFPAMTLIIGATLLLVAITAALERRLPRSASGLLEWSLVFAVACVLGALGWANQWAHFNTYMPAMSTGALACGAALPALAGVLDTWAERLDRGRGRAFRAWAAPVGTAVAALLLASNLVAARWSPQRFIPTPHDRAAGDALIERLTELRAHGDVYVPYHPWYARLAGQERAYVHRMSVMDIQFHGRHGVTGLREALSQARFAAVVVDNRPVGAELPGLHQGYRPGERIPASMAPRLYTGARVVPSTLWVPIRDEVPAGASVLFDFESRSFQGWQVEGTAWGRSPVGKPVAGQGLVTGYRGRSFATSMHGGDRSTGRLVSPPFAIEGARITLRLSGGDDARALRAELHVDGEVVRTAANATSSEDMRVHEWQVAELAGQEATLVLVDEATGSWGHINVDDVLMWRE